MDRRLERLADGFDAIACVVLPGGSADLLVQATGVLSSHLPMRIWHGEAEDLAASVESWREELRAAGLKKPLLLVSGGDDRPLRAAWPAPFMVRLADTDHASSADLVIEPHRLAGLERRVLEALELRLTEPKSLNILVLYCDDFAHIETIYEHLKSFALFSRHTVHYLPASDAAHRRSFEPFGGVWPQSWDLSFYDVVVWHYVVPAYLEERLSPLVAEQLASFDGLKILFVQDEYDSTATTSGWMRRVGVDVLFSCVPPDSWAYVYPQASNPGVEFFHTLTGYVPEDRGLERYLRPMAERGVRIGYRGRVLPFRYGRLAREKAVIGIEMKRLAESRDVKVDIAVDEESRIYGQDWYRFLGSVRATLATESGSNVFDFDGSLAALPEPPGSTFEAFEAEHLVGREDRVRMNQVSPKIFEAIRMRTALVCFEGDYSGVIRPGEHYIPLRKDFSNVDEVLAKLEDVALLEAITERAYADVIGAGRYSYAAFVLEFDRIVGERVFRRPRGEFISTPILRRRPGEDWSALVHPHPREMALNTGVLRGGLRRRELEEAIAEVRAQEIDTRRVQSADPPADAHRSRVWGPEAVVCYEFWRNAGAEIDLQGDATVIRTPPVAWHYAAGVPLDLSGIDFEHQHAWVRVRMAASSGPPLVSLYDAAQDALFDEQSVAETPGEVEILLRATSADASLLLFRTGPVAWAAQASLLGVELVVAAAYPLAVIEAARRIAHEAPFLLDVES